MSAPLLPRYTIGSVTGWKITAPSLNGSRRPDGNPPTLWYIQDRFFGYRPVESFLRGGFMLPMRVQWRCDELNAEHEDWLRDRGLL